MSIGPVCLTAAQSHALNKAFAGSHGAIIGWLNSDDAYFDRDAVADVVGCFQAHPEVDVVFGHAARADQQGRVSHVLWVPPFSGWLLHWKCFLSQPAVFFRRKALGDRFLDERFQFAMDWELWLRLARSCRFHRLNRVLAIDRDQPGRKINTCRRCSRQIAAGWRRCTAYGSTPGTSGSEVSTNLACA